MKKDEDKGVVFEGYVDDFMKLDLVLSKKSVENFRIDHDLNKNTLLHVQKLSPNNSVRINDKEYLLNDLHHMDVFDKNAKYIYEDIEEPLPPVNIYTRDYDDESIMMTKDRDGNFKSITLLNKMSGSSVDLKMIAPFYLVKVNPDDVNIEYLRRKFHFADKLTTKINPHLKVQNIRTNINEGVCKCKKQIQLAVAFESSFCTALHGKSNAEDEVVEIVAAVSQKYGQLGVCASVKISHIEGHCTALADPYRAFVKANKSGCEGYGLLDKFQTYWESHRRFVFRDTAHLFTGTGLECERGGGCVIGCAFVSSVCSDEAYGVDYITFSRNSNMRAVLIAHELGHNYGAEHYPADSEYIMYPSVTHAALGFSYPTQLSFKRNTFACVSTIYNMEEPSPSRLRDFIGNFVPNF